jgi:hypothetical protein
MKKAITAVLAVLMTVCFVGTGIAMEKGNKRKGKYTYRKVYKACHERGEVESATPFLSPNEKTQAEWDDTFDNKKFDQFKCQEEWSNLSDADLSDIYTYLWSHASDSPTPAKCK